MPPRVDAVILNYNTARLAIQAARSCIANRAAIVTVVDNASTDESLDILRTAAGPDVRLMALQYNNGFGAGMNLGARPGINPLILFMNADARLLENALAEMVDFLEHNQSFAAVAPALEFPGGKSQPSAYLLITPTRLFKLMLGLDKLSRIAPCLAGNIDPLRNGEYTGEVESLYGACFLIRRKAFDEAGGFDKRFFMYCEETDLCDRLRNNGWKLGRTARAKVVHDHDASAGQDPVAAYTLMQESRRIYADKHFSASGKGATRLACAAGNLLRVLCAPNAAARRKYRQGLGVWLGWTPSADPRRRS